MPLGKSTISRIILQLKPFSNPIVEMTMRFTTPDFAPSGARNKMIENENFRSFPC